MPLYEYICHTCGERFERLVRRNDSFVPVCPTCGGGEVGRAFSTFAAGRSRGGSSAAACGPAG
ncbi:MAG: zinc ribbon domain-containing protein [Ardenticatenaceae bacterium]|nr:zinc ribbon domain-containing protein [Ardenticatenaceae bacterium]